MPGKASRFVGATAVRQAQDRKASMVDRVAATILAGDHGTLHRAGDRMDLCPRCNPEVDARLLSGLSLAPPKRPRPERKPLKAAKAPKPIKPPKVKVAKPPAPRHTRPPAVPNEPRTRTFSAGVTEREHAAVYAAAAAAGKSPSTFVREIVLAALESRQ